MQFPFRLGKSNLVSVRGCHGYLPARPELALEFLCYQVLLASILISKFYFLFMLMRIRVGNLEDYRKDKRIIYWLTRGISEYGIYYSWATDKVNR